MLIKARAFIVGCIVLACSSCHSDDLGSAFFDGDVATRDERLSALPVERQWEIFKYGNQHRHPSATGLAVPIARRGAPALTYILNELDRQPGDLDLRDSLVVFQTMQWGKFYDICADRSVLGRIEKNQARIRDEQWRVVYREMFGNLCSVGRVSASQQQEK